MPVGPLQAAKRALVCALLAMAATYNVAITVDRDSSDDHITRVFRRVSARTHPDKGGLTRHAQELNAARDEWLDACGSQAARGAPSPKASAAKPPPGQIVPRTVRRDRPSSSAVAPVAPARPSKRKQYRINATAALLTYQRLPEAALGECEQFKSWIESERRESNKERQT